MHIVGVDFGTTNVRLSLWDSSNPSDLPVPVRFDNATTMPAVVAFQRQLDGEVSSVVGIEADGLEDGDETVGFLGCGVFFS